jgi:Bacterial regulatory helix-turn-helix protein, lysR family
MEGVGMGDSEWIVRRFYFPSCDDEISQKMGKFRYFVGVAETENVSRAALKLHIFQPALSRQVCDLEEEIGLALLKRAGKTVRLTEIRYPQPRTERY